MSADMVERLRELLERVEKCEGADREIDDSLRALFGNFMPWSAFETEDVVRIGDELVQASAPPLCPNNAAYHLPRYTANLQAAADLVEIALPGWYMMIDGSLMTSFEVSLTDSRVPSAEVREDVSRFFARGKTLPLAIVAATLRAKLALLRSIQGEK